MTTRLTPESEELERIRRYALHNLWDETSTDVQKDVQLLLAEIDWLQAEKIGLSFAAGWKEIDRKDYPKNYEKMKWSPEFMHGLYETTNEEMQRLMEENEALRAERDELKHEVLTLKAKHRDMDEKFAISIANVYSDLKEVRFERDALRAAAARAAVFIQTVGNYVGSTICQADCDLTADEHLPECAIKNGCEEAIADLRKATGVEK